MGEKKGVQMAGDHDMKIMQRERDHVESDGSTAPYAEHGAPIDRSKTADLKRPSNAALRWPRIRRSCRDAFSEFMGVFILILFGDGVVAQVTLSNGEKGDYQSISWGWVSSMVVLAFLRENIADGFAGIGCHAW